MSKYLAIFSNQELYSFQISFLVILYSSSNLIKCEDLYVGMWLHFTLVDLKKYIPSFNLTPATHLEFLAHFKKYKILKFGIFALWYVFLLGDPRSFSFPRRFVFLSLGIMVSTIVGFQKNRQKKGPTFSNWQFCSTYSLL